MFVIYLVTYFAGPNSLTHPPVKVEVPDDEGLAVSDVDIAGDRVLGVLERPHVLQVEERPIGQLEAASLVGVHAAEGHPVDLAPVQKKRVE